MFANPISSISSDSIDCTCPIVDGYHHVQWVGTWFGDCIRTPFEKLSFLLGLISLFCYFVALFPQMYHNYKRKSVDGLSFSLLLQWTIGDLSNYIGTITTQQLVTQKVISLYLLCTDVIVIIQYFWYSYTRPYILFLYNKSENQAEDDQLTLSDETEIVNENTPLLSSSSSSSVLQKHVLVITLVSCCIQSVHSLKNCDEKPNIEPLYRILGNARAWISGLLYLTSRYVFSIVIKCIKMDKLEFHKFYKIVNQNL